VFAPVVVWVTLAVWLEDGGPPLFSQSRVGQSRNPFTLLKFRSMRAAQVTRVGQWLRRTGIDELVALSFAVNIAGKHKIRRFLQRGAY
jgi:lipopolysaccharide/colanic/teichoic acid biosynthesis glycosyltransferase